MDLSIVKSKHSSLCPEYLMFNKSCAKLIFISFVNIQKQKRHCITVGFLDKHTLS